MKNIFVLIGPTSSGKTSLALDLAKEFNGAIISADSRQIYKYMDIGTGKLPMNKKVDIKRKEKCWVIGGIEVWGYDLAEPGELYSAYDFAEFALTKAKELQGQGKNVFLVGGTGLYIDIFTAKTQVANVGIDLVLRKSLENLTNEDLLKELTSLNVDRAKNIDSNNKVRLIRAIEVEIGKEKNTTPLPYLTNTNYIYLGLTSDRETLFSRADTWVANIWENGLVDEVNNLINLGFKDSPKLSGLIYKSVQDYINTKCSKEEAIQRSKFDVHAYIRRQQTWFKRNTNIKWFDITQETFSQMVKDQVKSNIDG